MSNENQKQIIKNNKQNDIFREVIYFDVNKPKSAISSIVSIVITISIILYLIKIIIIKRDIQLGTKSNNIISNILIVGIPVIYTQIFLTFFILKVICVNKLKMNIHVAIFLTSLFFAFTGYELWFMSPYNIDTINNKVIYMFIVSLFVSYSYYYTNNIISPILIFFLYKYINISSNKIKKK